MNTTPAAAMTHFGGFQAHDFDTAVRGTHWRHRKALGADLRLQLRRIYGRRYQTWGLPGANVLHIARRAAYHFPPKNAPACLFVSAGEEHLRWGLQFAVESEPWRGFVGRLQQDSETLPHLLYLLSAHGLQLGDPEHNDGGMLGGCWQYEKGELTWREAGFLARPVLAHDIPYRLEELTERGTLAALSLFAQIEPEEAMLWGPTAADHLIPALSALIPLYELCVAA